MQQKSTDQFWQDETGTKIPYARTTKAERLMERSTARIVREAKATSSKLAALKKLIATLTSQAYAVFMSEKDAKPGKGNFTMYNFDRSIKVEVNVNEPIVFDDLTISAAKAKFDEFLEKNVTTSEDFIKQMIMEAFETTRSRKLDTKRVMNLIRYREKVKDPLFSEAVGLIEEAIRHPQTKTYYKVYEKAPNGEYELIDLNIASI